MEGGSLSTDDFKSWAQNDVVPFLSVMTRIPDRENDALLRDYGGTGFPYLIYLDGDGNKIGKPTGRDMDAFKAGASAANDLLSLRKKVAKGVPGLECRLLLLELQMGAANFEDAKGRREALKKPRKGAKEWKVQVGEIDALLLDLEIDTLIRTTRRDKEAWPDTEILLYEMANEGKFPSKFNRSFWSAVLNVSKKRKDSAMFQKGYDAYLEAYGKNPRAKKMLDGMKADLDALKEDG